MTEEFDKYQNIKLAILIVAWDFIEKSRDLSINKTAIINQLKPLFDELDLNHQKVSVLLEEIVETDNWLKYKRGFDGKKNRMQFNMQPKGREAIDEFFKTKSRKLIDWIHDKAPSVAKYIDETIVKPAISAGINSTIKS